MAAIKGFTEAQNACLAQVEVGNLILIDQITEDSDDEENDSDSDGENESDDDGNEDDDDEEQPVSDDGDSSSESDSESGADTEHAEHIEDVSRADTGSPNIIEYRTLRAAKGSNHDDTEEHLITVYLVVKVAKTAKGAVKDLSLVPLKYSDKADVSPGTFQLYGTQCVPSLYTGGTADKTSQLEKEFISIRDLPGGESLRFTASPQGDHVRNVVLGGECSACDGGGWLDCITQLEGMVKDYTIPSSLPNEPTVCPSCIGIELMKEHQDLRAELEAFSRISDFGAIVAFHGRLAARRRELDYEFYQFDERKWGYLFDDMVSDDDEGGGDDGRYEVWDEATDPSNGAILHPASDATIKSLPVKKYAEVKTEDGAQCVVCREEFKDDQRIMQLPCNHYFCEDGCTVQWLKQHDNCPVCRARVPPVVEHDGKKAVHDGNALDADAGAEQEQDDAAPDQVVSTDRDDDVTMVDAW